ncbi:MAG: hypothetical protein PHV05_05065 [Candidatus Riflebacteria bacterium]|nr:hypothetical protein [Candidatus Riflebacteria bacterium]
MSWEYKLGSFLKSVTDLIGITPKNSSPTFSQLIVSGVIEQQEGNIENAVSAFKMAAFLNPSSDEPYFLLGTCYTEKEDYNAALNEYFFALDLSRSPKSISRASYGCHGSLLFLKEISLSRIFLQLASLFSREEYVDCCEVFLKKTESMITSTQLEREPAILQFFLGSIRESRFSIALKELRKN